MKKSILEQELTKEQVQWLLNNPDHDETKKIIIGAKVADWDGIKEESHDHFKKYTLVNFRKWWLHNNPIITKVHSQ